MSLKDDHVYMGRALELAQRGHCTTMPNPAVGCVIVKDNKIIGEGWHQIAGEPHAEINALNDAGDRAEGATVYVTLEPCCHHGKTPPCSNALLEAKVSRVVAAMQDPNPDVAGKGMEQLQQAGIETSCGLMQQQAIRLNKGFCQRMKHGRPYVTSKLAMSVDGRTAMASGESKWITSADARKDVQALRRCSTAIMTGSGTIKHDDPQLSVRNDQGEPDARQPLKVVIDSELKLSPDARLFQDKGEKIIFTSNKTDRAGIFSNCNGVSVHATHGDSGKVSLTEVLQQLASLQINDVLLECGAELNGAMLQAGLIDELVIYMAPKLMGNNARALFNLPGLSNMSDNVELDIIDIRAVGQDWRITAVIKQLP